MIIDTTNDELLINGQRWQRGGYLQATAYGTEQINITARDGRVIGKALQWDAIYDEDKNLFGLNRDGVVTALTAVFDSRVKSPYNLEALRDVQDGTASYGDTLIWSAPGEWQYDTLTQYHHAYNSEAATLRAGATATTELYYTAQADGDGLSESAESNTPAEGYQIVRKLYYAEAAQADPDTGTWVQFADLDPNTTYASAKATLLAYLKERTGGTVPISLKMTWEQVEEFDGLLDSYGGAAAAYSVRRLSSTYTGPLIEVERASDSTTQDIGYDSNGDLDTAAIATFCSGTTCGVRVWYDQSGNSNDATQTTFANQPTIYTGGAVVLRNTKPAIIDNTSGDNSLDLTYNVVDGSWIFSVCQIETAFTSLVQGETAAKFLLVAQDGVGSSPNSGVSNVSTYIDGTSQSLTSRNVVYDTFQQQRLLSLSFDNDSWTQFNIGYPGSITVDMMTMQEIVLYPSDQSSNRSGIETNVNDYFGIYTPFTTGLLDDYGGAAAAYSLRRLSSTYTGPLIRVRRASDNAEQDISADIEGNLNTGALAAFCSGTNGFVKTWYCQSGNGNDATQTTTGNQPKIYDSSTGVVENNGKPSLLFGSSAFMADTSWNGDATTYIFHVLQSNGAESSPRIGIDVGSFVEYYGFGLDGNSGASFAGITSFAQYANGTSLGFTRDNVWDALQSQSILTVSGDFSTWTGGFGLTRSGQQMYSYAQEVVIYNSDQSANRTGIESNINTFYSIY
jgi:hypothetical protein